ncbi:piggyBac transposable element-derived protein 4-like [Schistocerca piceifrons]|uniref:piggyBac transposable element-derived protein 4-like n=1 Tax=Schistocerca piceifrons TaxID=274613 RepID=UPI001F5E5434|nr:piggyBac transposable element-derived protein 4-like [Schistocerca piceifrons]
MTSYRPAVDTVVLVELHPLDGSSCHATQHVLVTVLNVFKIQMLRLVKVTSIQKTSDNETLLQQTVPSEFVRASSVRIQYLFSGNSGTVVPLKQNDVMSCFMCFVDDALCTMIAEQTNLYAEQFIASHPNLAACSRVHSRQNTTRDEVKTLIGMLVLQGILHKADHKMYFSKRESVDTPFFRKAMSEKQFHLLLKFLHFADNTSYDPLVTISRKLFKIHPIMEHLWRKFRSVYMPERNITIDKSLLLWKGWLGWKQYIPSKRSRSGIKLFNLCESGSGYVWDFIVYTRKGTNYGSHYPDEKITSRIVLELAHNLLGKGHCIYLDIWYTSTDLVDKLTSNNTDVVSTMCSVNADMKHTKWSCKNFSKADMIKGTEKIIAVLLTECTINHTEN